MIKSYVENALLSVLKELNLKAAFTVEVPPDKKFGDFSTNAAMLLVKDLKKAPRQIAEDLKQKLLLFEGVKEIKIEGPGFINFFLNKEYFNGWVKNIFDEGGKFGSVNEGKNKKVMIEYVSANPTGPLHIGHGRGAVLGDVLSNILKFAGYDVFKEYYINDSGNQMETLGYSLYYRYSQILNLDTAEPENYYKGGYIKDIAIKFKEEHGEDKTDFKTNKQLFIDFAKDEILNDIRADLESFNACFDGWFSEKKLYEENTVEKVKEYLIKNKLAYKKDGALWFSTENSDDDKDRVLVKADGSPTYFLADIAYHYNKIKERKFDYLINIWGADHHGYVERLKSAVAIIAEKPADEIIDIMLYQLVNLIKDGEKVAMSTREGRFVELKEVVREVGADVARFIFLTRKHDSFLDFDIDLAKKESLENPVYYVQYAYARICSILKKGKEENGVDGEKVKKFKDLSFNDDEYEIIFFMLNFKSLIKQIANKKEVHHLTGYAVALAALFHKYYNKHKVLNAQTEKEVYSRLYMLLAVKQIFENISRLLNITLPEKM